MLSNAYFLAKFRFDTAENEPAKKFEKFANFADPSPLTLTVELRRLPAAWDAALSEDLRPLAPPPICAG